MDFTDPRMAADWVPVDDRIMGGSSLSSVLHVDGATQFSGELIVEGGGFASARYSREFNLPPNVECLSLEASGDGRMGYKLTLTSCAAPSGVSYQCALPRLEEGSFTPLRLPLDTFRPTYRGRAAPEAPALRAADVVGIGLMLSRYEVSGGVKESIPPGRFCMQLRRLASAESELAKNGRRWV
jgi:NADH dehydrogenase [ubiquinone] 1 alpha subcomplex assembly factor 1